MPVSSTESPDPPDVPARLRGLRSLVGNTPLLEIGFRVHGARRRLFAKAESLNMTGSVKDRMALHILTCGYEHGVLSPGDRIVEVTSGNTGISFAAIGRALGHPVTIFMPDWMSSERVNLIRALGASIVMVSREQGGFVGAIRLAEEMAATQPSIFLPRQFANDDNSQAHESSTGPEIYLQLRGQGLAPDAVVAGVGTGGTIMGIGRYLRSEFPDVRVHPLEPASSPTLAAGHRVGSHRIQGISDEFIPPIVDLDFLDAVIDVEDGDAILMAQKLAASLGLGVGISAGANFLGAAQLVEELGPEAIVVTVLPDSNKKYLSTDLLRDEPVREHYRAPGIELSSLRGLQRVCAMCYPDEDVCETDPLAPTR